ncbi:hydrogenase formation protein HypD [Desulforhopalus vacuolatus]|uniref:hydrogenase formation protein HypD n=1 Tax=Desulforhopalus vacuolatus TaxID=40414 RepID=UPI003084216A
MRKMEPVLDRSEELLKEIYALVDRPIRLMLACGNQNRTLLKNYVRAKLPASLELVAGPGCSVCVMPAGHIDAFVKVASQPGVITAVCEDLLQVRGSKESLASICEKGARVELINTPQEALDIARHEPDSTVVYVAAGFEATAPNVAETILYAAESGLENFCVIPSIRLLPPTIGRLMENETLHIEGLLCSDNNNVVSDTDAYSNLARKYNLPCCIAGFTLEDVLEGLLFLVRQVKAGTAEVSDDSAFSWSPRETNAALCIVSEVFCAVETDWRGLGTIARSGFVIRDELALFDATRRFNVHFTEGHENSKCRCNEIISGRSIPTDCPFFGMGCTPESPVGPCMISDEGICHSYFKYELQSP